jgi:hypothetical protein
MVVIFGSLQWWSRAVALGRHFAWVTIRLCSWGRVGGVGVASVAGVIAVNRCCHAGAPLCRHGRRCASCAVLDGRSVPPVCAHEWGESARASLTVGKLPAGQWCLNHDQRRSPVRWPGGPTVSDRGWGRVKERKEFNLFFIFRIWICM